MFMRRIAGSVSKVIDKMTATLCPVCRQPMTPEGVCVTCVQKQSSANQPPKDQQP